ncbi:MAG: hypothetical protein KC464_31500 [Myxococcales bacterium]|nr:hypothetical protein [Myxococcales bacterium]
MPPAAKLIGLSIVAAVAATARPALADADSLVDNLGAREVGVGEAMRAGAIGATGPNLNPAGLPLTSELVFEGGYGYRGADGASLFNLAVCDSTNAMPGCFYYDYMSSDPELDGMALGHRRSHSGGLTLSRTVSPRVIVGVGAKYFDYSSDVMGEDSASGANWDVGTLVRLTDLVNVAAVGYNLWGAKSVQFPRAIGTGMMAHPLPALSASFDAVWNLDAADGAKTGRYGGGVEYFLSTRQGTVGYPLRGGALHDVATGGTYVTAGLGISTLKLGLDVGARKQVADGDELLITANLRFFGPRQPRQ